MIGYRDLDILGPSHSLYHTNSEMTVSVWYPAESVENLHSQIRYLDHVKGSAYIGAPIKSGKFPVIFFSHGSHGFRSQSWRVMEKWAQAGYLVFSIDHRGSSTFDTLSLKGYRDSFALRPLEIIQLIRHLENLPEDNWLSQHLLFEDEGKIVSALAGHSLGGLTALYLGGATANTLISKYLLKANKNAGTYKNYFKALIPMSPAGYTWFFKKCGIEEIQIPTMIVNGKSDIITPSAIETVPIYFALKSKKSRVLIKNAGHHTFCLAADIPLVKFFLLNKEAAEYGAQVSDHLAKISLLWLDKHLLNKDVDLSEEACVKDFGEFLEYTYN